MIHSIGFHMDIEGGSAAFVLAVIITSPSGVTVQIGGFQNWYTNKKIWSRYRPDYVDTYSSFTTVKFTNDIGCHTSLSMLSLCCRQDVADTMGWAAGRLRGPLGCYKVRPIYTNIFFFANTLKILVFVISKCS